MSFFAELKRRNVVRVGIAYVVIGWVLAQVAEFAFETFGAPDWALKSFVVALVLGLPVALIFAWAFEVTPEGLKRERYVDRSESVTRDTAGKLDRVIIVVLLLAVGILLADRFVSQTGEETDEITASQFRQSIAVLPFANLSDDNDNFADGLSEELLNLLAKTPDLKVAARTSTFAFKGRNEDLREIGDTLGVEHVLEGSVRRSGDRLRITAQLIKVADGFHVWSETYDRAMADIFDIQDDVANAIAGTLKLRLAPESSRVTKNADAYALYLEALSMYPLTDGDAYPGIRLLDRAIAQDPDFAKAYELKALLYWDASGWTISGRETQLIIHDLCTRALILDDSLNVARLLQAFSEPVSWNWSREIAAIDEALAAEPGNTTLLGVAIYDLITAGYFTESLALARRYVEIDPLSRQGWSYLGKAYIALGQRDLARESWERSIALGGSYLVSIYRVADLLMAGELGAAIPYFEANAAKIGFATEEVRPFVAAALDEDTGIDFLSKWIDSKIADARNYEEQYAPYYWYLYFGYLDEFWRVIQAMDDESPSTWDDTGNMEHTGRVNRSSGFASHPAYIPFVMRSGLTALWESRGDPDTCRKTSGEWVCE